jgi:hypothetical protein
MNRTARYQFAGWLAKNYPEFFEAVAAHATNASNLSGWTDILSSIGSGISKAATVAGTLVQRVGDFVGTDDGQKTLSSLANIYMQTQANKAALKVQQTAMSQGAPPAPIVTTTQPVTGETVPMYAPPNQPAKPLTPAVTQQLIAGTSTATQPDWKNIAMVAIVGASALLVVSALKRRAQ